MNLCFFIIKNVVFLTIIWLGRRQNELVYPVLFVVLGGAYLYVRLVDRNDK